MKGTSAVVLAEVPSLALTVRQTGRNAKGHPGLREEVNANLLLLLGRCELDRLTALCRLTTRSTCTLMPATNLLSESDRCLE